MVLPPDYHLHTAFCRHATGWPADYAACALEHGLTEIGFSDHAPLADDTFDDWRMRQDQLAEYVAQVRFAQGRHPSLTIKLGLELDYFPGQIEWIKDLAGRYPWDYLIGSVHYARPGWAIDNPAQRGEWDRYGVFETWALYFERLSEAVNTGLFDIIGHPDLPKKFGYYPDQDCTPLYRRFLESARKHPLALELNTAGLRKECREIYPGITFLRLACAVGVPITFGSDAHAPAEVGLNLAAAVALARQAGYTHSCRFSQRQASPSVF